MTTWQTVEQTVTWTSTAGTTWQVVRGSTGGGGGGGASAINDLTDVDTATDPPATDDVLAWDGSLWTPAALTAADTGAIPESLIDAKGDLIVGTAADTAARLGVGSDGQVLTADSAEAGGVKWAAAAGGGAVDSVNGQTGVVVLDAGDVGAQPADTDLTTLAGLTPTTDSFIQAKSSAWAARTIDQVKSDLGVSSPPLFVTARINEYVGMPSPNVASQGISNYVLGAAGRGNISPIWLPAATYDRIGVYVPTGGTATLRLGLYTADATTGLPGTKVFDAGTISAASTGLIEATISQTLSTGWYWAAVVTDAYTSTFELMGFGDSSAPTLFGSVSQTSGGARQRVALCSSAWTTGGLTTSPPTLEWASAGVKVVLRRSA